jgi:hypothetical protein
VVDLNRTCILNIFIYLIRFPVSYGDDGSIPREPNSIPKDVINSIGGIVTAGDVTY